MNEEQERSRAWNAFFEKDDKVSVIKAEIAELIQLRGRVTSIIESDRLKNRIELMAAEIAQLESLAKEAIQDNGSIEPLIAELGGEATNDATAEPKASATTTVAKLQIATPVTKRRRTDGLSQAMRVGITSYRCKHRTEPTARALFEWLRNHDETDNIVEFNESLDLITWRKSDGGLIDTPFKTFQNRFTTLKE